VGLALVGDEFSLIRLGLALVGDEFSLIRLGLALVGDEFSLIRLGLAPATVIIAGMVDAVQGSLSPLTGGVGSLVRGLDSPSGRLRSLYGLCRSPDRSIPTRQARFDPRVGFILIVRTVGWSRLVHANIVAQSPSPG
jgi:hypothetical protein